MPVIAIERPKQTGSGEYRRPTAQRDYVISGTLDKVVAVFAMLEKAPRYEDGVDLQTGLPITIFRNKFDIKELGGGVWEGSVRYEASPDSVDLSIQYGVRTKKLYNALKQRKTYDCISGITIEPGGDYSISNVPDFGTQINVTDDGVEGVDIEVGAVDITITKKWKRVVLDVGYLQTLLVFNDRTPVNHEPWTFLWLGQTLTFAKGSLRFRASSVQSNSEEELSMSYNFAYSGPITADDDFTVGNSAQIIAEGHDHVGIYYKKESVGSKEVTTPYGVIVHQVYPYKDFNLLALDA